jgi:hypothetical protein
MSINLLKAVSFKTTIGVGIREYFSFVLRLALFCQLQLVTAYLGIYGHIHMQFSCIYLLKGHKCGTVVVAAHTGQSYQETTLLDKVF